MGVDAVLSGHSVRVGTAPVEREDELVAELAAAAVVAVCTGLRRCLGSWVHCLEFPAKVAFAGMGLEASIADLLLPLPVACRFCVSEHEVKPKAPWPKVDVFWFR